jgi:hypothetical protein
MLTHILPHTGANFLQDIIVFFIKQRCLNRVSICPHFILMAWFVKVNRVTTIQVKILHSLETCQLPGPGWGFSHHDYPSGWRPRTRANSIVKKIYSNSVRHFRCRCRKQLPLNTDLRACNRCARVATWKVMNLKIGKWSNDASVPVSHGKQKKWGVFAPGRKTGQ